MKEKSWTGKEKKVTVYSVPRKGAWVSLKQRSRGYPKTKGHNK